MTPRSTALLPRVIPLGLTVLLLGLLAGVAMLDRHDGVRAWAFWDDARRWDDGGLAVAREEVVNFFDLDHRRIDDDVAQVLSLATGDFAKEYATKRKELVATVKEKQAVWTASIPDGGSAVEYVDGDRAAVLVAVDVEKSLAGAPPAPERDRVRVLLRHVDETWLVSDFQVVG